MNQLPDGGSGANSGVDGVGSQSHGQANSTVTERERGGPLVGKPIGLC